MNVKSLVKTVYLEMITSCLLIKYDRTSFLVIDI